MKAQSRLVLAIALATALLAASGCMIRREPIPGSDETRSDTESVSLDGATSARVRLDMGAGELSIGGARLAGDLLRGTFDYSPASMRPELEGQTIGSLAEATVSQPNVHGFPLGGQYRNEWALQLAKGVPMELSISMGAGESDLDLSELDLTSFRLDMGAGDTTVDLSGKRVSDLDASITAGAAEVTVRLPEDVGVRVSGRSDGIGDWNYDGFTQDGAYLVNDAYDSAGTTIDLDVQRGVGVVTLELVD